MKRHPALQDLSRDHHVVLIRCQIIRRALERAASDEEILRLGRGLAHYFETDWAAHVQEEDDFVVREAERTSDQDLVATARTVHQDHRWFRERFQRLLARPDDPGAVREILGEIEPRLTRHVRREETELFEGLQRAVSDEKLQSMWRASYAFRVKNRSESACTLRPA